MVLDLFPRLHYPLRSIPLCLHQCSEGMNERVRNEVMPLNRRVSISVCYAFKEAWSYPVNCP